MIQRAVDIISRFWCHPTQVYDILMINLCCLMDCNFCWHISCQFFAFNLCFMPAQICPSCKCTSSPHDHHHHLSCWKRKFWADFFLTLEKNMGETWQRFQSILKRFSYNSKTFCCLHQVGLLVIICCHQCVCVYLIFA